MTTGDYLVRRGECYHFRIKVPEHLTEIIGRRELRRSLRDRSYVESKPIAQQLAWVTLRIFTYTEIHMDTLSTTDITRLLDDWQERMLKRDDQIRMEIEADLHEWTPQTYGEHCDGNAEALQGLLERVTFPAHGEEGERPTTSCPHTLIAQGYNPCNQ